MEAKVSTMSDSRIAESLRIGVRLKISALWVAMLFLFAYGDIFGSFVPGRIDDIRGGTISGIEITQTFLLAASVYVAIASLMIFLTLVLRPNAQPLGQHRAADPVHRLDRRVRDRGIVGVLLVPEHR
jgi:hypothetical protein